MTQIDHRYDGGGENLPVIDTRLDIRHTMLIVLLATLPVIPMPIAGGTPILIGVMVLIYLSFMTFPSQAAFLDRADQYYLYIGVALLLWEVVALSLHPSNKGALFVLGRGMWLMLAIAIIMAMNILYMRAGMHAVTWVLVLSLLVLLTAMLIEASFFPKRAVGRNLGFFAIPFPRATGVPNSDGKLGTFLSICLCYGLFLRVSMPHWQRVALVAGPYIGLSFLQSRSTLLALLIVTGIYLLYSLMRSRTVFVAFLKLTGVLLLAGVFLYNFLWLLKLLIGQGIFYANIFGRFELYALAIQLIPEGPIFGLGADAILSRGQAGEVHNTFLAMAVKSGVPAAILTAVTIFAPVIMFARGNRMILFTVAVCLAIAAEHSLYPGRINEYQILCFIVAKLAWIDHFGQREA